MSFFDLALAIIIGGFGLFGLWFGLVHTLGSLVGTVLGVYLASRYYGILADWLINLTGWTGNFPRVIMFIIAFVVINRLVGLLFWFFDRAFSIITRLPFVNSLNRLLGLAFGLLEGVLAIGIIFYFIARFPLGQNFMSLVAASKIVPFTVAATAVLWPFIPTAIKIIKSSLEPFSL